MKTNDLILGMSEFIAWLKVERNCGNSSITHHKYHLIVMAKEMDVFNEENCRKFLAELRDIRSLGTVENYIYTIRVLCWYLMSCGIIAHNWGKDIPLPKREKNIPTILSVSEIELILKVDLPQTYRHYPSPLEARELFDTILTLLTLTGARVGEVVCIKIEDINWVDGVWTLNHTKTRSGRVIPIPPSVLPVMNRLAGTREPQVRLFINPFSKLPVTTNNVETNFRMRLKKINLRKRVTVHTLRHSFITELLRADISVLKIANIVGHEQIATTQAYAKLLYEDLRDAILRHPMTVKARDPKDILTHLKSTIQRFKLSEDTRFHYSLTEEGNGLILKVSKV